MKVVTTQADLDAGLQAGELEFEVQGDIALTTTGTAAPTLRVRGTASPRVVAYDSSQPRVVASGSSQPRVEAYGSSQPRVVAYDSSQPRVEAYGSSQPRVVAYGSSQPRVVAYGSSQPRVVAYDSSQVSTAGNVAIEVKSPQVTIAAEQVAAITGVPAHIVKREPLTSIETWCQEYGLTITDGTVTLFKAVRDNYQSQNGGEYTPGTMPIAKDWDGGKAECGGGLHFSPRPVMALGFDRDATRFMACPVAIVDIRTPKASDRYKSKVKAKGCCGPVVECDLDGEPIVSAEAVPA